MEKNSTNRTNVIFKILSVVLLKTKKHVRVIRKILAAFLKEHWELLYPHWKHTGGYQLASECSEMLSTGKCNWPLAVNVAAHLFKTPITVSSKNGDEQMFGQTSAVLPIRLFTYFDKAAGEPVFQILSGGSQLDENFTDKVHQQSTQTSSRAVQNSKPKMATISSSDHVESTISTRCEATITAFAKNGKAKDKMAAPSSEHVQLSDHEARDAAEQDADSRTLPGGPLDTAAGRTASPRVLTKASSTVNKDMPLRVAWTVTRSSADSGAPTAKEDDHHLRTERHSLGPEDDTPPCQGMVHHAEIQRRGRDPSPFPMSLAEFYNSLVQKRKENEKVKSESAESENQKSESVEGEKGEGENQENANLASVECSFRVTDEVSSDEDESSDSFQCNCGEDVSIPNFVLKSLKEANGTQVQEILQEIFIDSKKSSWEYHPKWHHLHMIKEKYWVKKKLSKLVPGIKYEMSSRRYEKAKEIFEENVDAV